MSNFSTSFRHSNNLYLLFFILSVGVQLKLHCLKLHYCSEYCAFLQIGIIGLIEYEWLATLATIDPEDVEYIDFIDRARDLVCDLRDNEVR